MPAPKIVDLTGAAAKSLRGRDGKLATPRQLAGARIAPVVDAALVGGVLCDHRVEALFVQTRGEQVMNVREPRTLFVEMRKRAMAIADALRIEPPNQSCFPQPIREHIRRAVADQRMRSQQLRERCFDDVGAEVCGQLAISLVGERVIERQRMRLRQPARLGRQLFHARAHGVSCATRKIIRSELRRQSPSPRGITDQSALDQVLRHVHALTRVAERDLIDLMGEQRQVRHIAEQRSEEAVRFELG